MKIEVDPDAFEALVAKWAAQSIIELGEETGIPLFSTDPKVDRKERKKLAKAFKHVHNYITPKSENI